MTPAMAGRSQTSGRLAPNINARQRAHQQIGADGQVNITEAKVSNCRRGNGMCQDSESVIVESPLARYPAPLSTCIEEGTIVCPYCQENATQELKRMTALGYPDASPEP